MTRPSALVLDGNEVKLRLQAERNVTGSAVHVDWLRFTMNLRYAPTPSIDDLFPQKSVFADDERNRAKLYKILRELPDSDFAASAQAKTLAEQVCDSLGVGFTVYPELRKGHDFYRFRWSIVRNDAEVGWVGFLSSGDSPRQAAQSKTIHCNLHGAACTFARPGWSKAVANLIDQSCATITRCDLALDFFQGFAGGMERVKTDYEAGSMNVNGRQPKCNLLGDWCNHKSRSFYFGSKEAGKQTNVYEKGHQLFGEKDSTQWLRVELRYGNKLRVLPSDILRRPADFFAGASDWHSLMLLEADAIAEPEKVTVTTKRALETIRAEVVRNVRWLRETAAPSVAAAFQFLGSEFLEIVSHQKVPGRLQRFSIEEIRDAYKAAFSHVSTGISTGPAAYAFT